MSSPPSADEIKRRICAELEYDGEGWLDRACVLLQAQVNSRRWAKVYDISTIGGRLRCARELAGMLQAELGRRVGIKQPYISKMERGLSPLPALKVAGICMSLSIRRDWLLMLSDEGGPQGRYGILRSGQSPKQAKETARARLRAEALAQVRARSDARNGLTLPVNSQQSCPTTESPLKTPRSEEAAKPPCLSAVESSSLGGRSG